MERILGLDRSFFWTVVSSIKHECVLGGSYPLYKFIRADTWRPNDIDIFFKLRHPENANTPLTLDDVMAQFAEIRDEFGARMKRGARNVVLNQFYPWQKVGIDRWEKTDTELINRGQDKEDFHICVVGVLTMHFPASRYFKEDSPRLKDDFPIYYSSNVVYFNDDDPVRRNDDGNVKVQFVMIDPSVVEETTVQATLEKIADIPVFASMNLGAVTCTRNSEEILSGNLGTKFCKDPNRREKYIDRGFRFE